MHPVFLWLVMAFMFGLAGCQMSGPPNANPILAGDKLVPNFRTETQSSFKAIDEPTTTVRVRGQSPQWSSSNVGVADSGRMPMRATEVSSPTQPFANTNAQLPMAGYPSQNYSAPNYSAANYSAAQSGQFATSPLQGSSQAPVYPGNVPAAPIYPPPSQSVLQPPGVPYAGGIYGSPGPAVASPSDYGHTVVPGVLQVPGNYGNAIAPGAYPGYDPSGVPYPDISAAGGPRRPRISPIDVYVQERRSGRIIFGGSVNSDLGVAGQVIIDERSFDIRDWPRTWGQFWSGQSFRGGGQNFRAELMPGNEVQRYTVSWSDNNLFDLPYSLSVGGFYYTRQLRDWDEQRLGGRVALGNAITRNLSISAEIRAEDVDLSDPRIAGVTELDAALGSSDVYTARFRLANDTRDNPFLSTEGAFLELIFDQVFGEYDFSRGNLNYSRYFLVRERPDEGGRHTLASTWRIGVTGSQTPIFENYFAGGYSSLRGFRFRGASPKVGDVQVGGELSFLGSLEYVFPLTADEMLRGVAFVDYGTVEQDLKIDGGDFRVAPGLGLRVSVPALGPAPLAFDFAYPVTKADSDETQVFSFFLGLTR